MNEHNQYRIERAIDRGTWIEYWPVWEKRAPYTEVMRTLAAFERTYSDTSFRVIMVV